MQIILDMTNKRSGTALSALNELESKYSKYYQFYLLRCCARIRESVIVDRTISDREGIEWDMDNNYENAPSITQLSLLQEDLSKTMKMNAPLDHYGIIIGI